MIGMRGRGARRRMLVLLGVAAALAVGSAGFFAEGSSPSHTDQCGRVLHPYRGHSPAQINQLAVHTRVVPAMSGFASETRNHLADVTAVNNPPVEVKTVSSATQGMGYVVVDVGETASRFVGCLQGPTPGSPTDKGLATSSAPIHTAFSSASTLVLLPVSLPNSPYFSDFQIPVVPVAEGAAAANAAPPSEPIYPVLDRSTVRLQDVEHCRSHGCSVIRTLVIDVPLHGGRPRVIRDSTVPQDATSAYRLALPPQPAGTVRLVAAMSGIASTGPFLVQAVSHAA